MTGDLNQIVKCLRTSLFIFLLSSSHTVSSSSTQQIQPQNDPPSSVPVIPTHYYQVFDLKNNDPIFQEHFKKRLKKKKHRKKTAANKNLIKPRPFSVMLPKGFIPPSRSSPCHNEYPTSMTFHCHLDHKN